MLPAALFLFLIGCLSASPPSPPPDAPPAALDGVWMDGPVLPASAFVVDSEGPEADLTVTTTFLQTRPAHQRSLTAGLQPVPGIPDLHASTCAGCHPEAAATWRRSSHAHAWSDPLFQAELWQAEHRWTCLACHTPLLLQQDLWPRDVVLDDEGALIGTLLAPNERFEPALREEGVSCAACHVRDGVVLAGRTIEEAPHPVVADEGLRTGAMCSRCHQVAAQGQQIPFPCTSQTRDEQHLAQTDATCVSCHMPATPNGVDHGWVGPTGVMAHRVAEAAAHSALQVSLAREGEALALGWANQGAAHRLPTTDRPQYIQLDLHFHDAQGAPLHHWTHRVGRLTGPPPAQALRADQRLLPGDQATERIPIPEGAAEAKLVVTAWRLDPEHAGALNLPDPPAGVPIHQQTLRLAEP